MSGEYTPESLPRSFIAKRLHSLTGLFLVLYLIEHLFVNSQAALFFGEHGLGFIKDVNKIQELPYLRLIEIFLIGVPIVLHTWWGIENAWTGKPNSYGYIGNQVYLPEYSRNHFYTWQRITAWILVIGIALHVIHMRFLEYPVSKKVGNDKEFLVKLNKDPGLEDLSKSLGFKIYDQNSIQETWKGDLEKNPLKEGQVVAVSNTFGLAELLMVRDAFKSPILIALYTIFVLSACFHGFNGLWTAMISWGVTLTQRSQMWMRYISTALMLIVAFWGLAAIWATYWINLG